MLPSPSQARADELAGAFRLVFRHLPATDRDARLRNALHLIQRGEFDPAGVIVLRTPDALAGTIVCTTVPGAGALVWPPVVIAQPAAPAEDALVRHAAAWLRGRGTRLAQALLRPEEAHLAEPLLRNGFVHVTDLWFLSHDLLAVPSLAAPGQFTFEPYDLHAPAEFHATLERTYAGSLDCPEVNGVRTIDEVIAGHKAQGAFDPNRWWLARHKGAPVAVLLLAEMPESADWELAYTGVVPEARRRGFGRAVLRHALAEARRGGAGRLTLSVDARNQPAWDLYRWAGFEAFERRSVLLAVWAFSEG
jgi:ribosomal protein S18 acetylase RimI-like enzyme